MKSLTYLNLSTHMGSWVGVMLEGDTEVNCLHGLYLKEKLNLNDSRTNISYENWFTLSYAFFCFEWP